MCRCDQTCKLLQGILGRKSRSLGPLDGSGISHSLHILHANPRVNDEPGSHAVPPHRPAVRIW